MTALIVVEVFVVDQLVATAFGQQRLILDQADLHVLRHFRFLRLAPQLLQQRLHGFLHLAGILADAARQPVAAAQFIQHGAPDALYGIGLELRAMGFLVAVDGVEQAHHAGLDQVVHLHARGQLGLELMRQFLDQRRMLLQDVVLALLSLDVIHARHAPRLAPSVAMP
jgi:hypothetical protein